MGKKLIISESEATDIRRMYGLLKEQTSTFSVPPLAVQAISKIEGTFGRMLNGKISPLQYDGDEMLGVMENYVRDTIGFDCWNNMSEKLQAQIYSFCFQSDSDVPYKMKFIAGLANAIDPSIDRLKVVRKPLKNPDVQNAIKTIKRNCSNINDYYSNYLNIIDSQYKAADYDNNYKYIWKYRPRAIERLMNGEDWNVVKKDWMKSFSDPQTQAGKVAQSKTERPPITTLSTQPKPQSAKNIISINSNSLIELRNKLNEKTANISIDIKSVVPNFKKGSYSISFEPGTTKIKKLSLVFDNISAQTLDDRMIELDRINNLQRISIGETVGEDGSPRWYVLSYIPSE